MRPISLSYASRTGKTKRIAYLIQSLYPKLVEVPVTLNERKPESFLTFSLNILCFSTYGMGELEYRWVKFMESFDREHIRGSKFGLVALGDQKYHGLTFAGSIRHMLDYLDKSQLVGRWPSSAYNFKYSEALDQEGFFPGLVLDEISESHLSEQRIRVWMEGVVQQVGLFLE